MFTIISKELIVGSEPPFASCHASHLALLPGGDIIAVWFAGSKEGAGDVAIWCSRRTEGSWTKPLKLADEEELPHWNPVFHTKENGDLLLFYKVGVLLKEWYTRVKVSQDQGINWSDSVELVEGDRGGRGPVRNKIVVLSDQSWLAPGSNEDGIWFAFADRSVDQGQTWLQSNPIHIEGLGKEDVIEEVTGSDIPVSPQSFFGRGVIQPTLWESEPGVVHMLLRSSEGRIYRSDSMDGGQHWCKAYPTDLPNNNSGIDVIKLENGMLVLAYNPIEQNWGVRTPLVLSTSSDNGRTWSEPYVLEDGEGEFSYPAVIASGNELYITYTWKRENIRFCHFQIQT